MDITYSNLVKRSVNLDNFISFSYLAESSSYYYGEDVYNGSNSSSVYSGSVNNTANNGLINTGTIAGLTAVVGGLIIFGAILTKFWKRPKNNSK